MKKFFATTSFLLAAGFAGAAAAATITNRDDTAHTLVVSEGGSQSELSIGAGETIQVCPSGCFVTMPNGDREALTGSETLEIQGGRGKIL